MVDPEAPDGSIGMRQGEAIRGFGVGEAGGIKIKSEPLRARPLNPTFKVGGFDFVPIDAFSAELAVACMEVETMAARDERERPFEISTQLTWVTGLSGIVACDGETTAERSGSGLKSAYIVALPAMYRHGNTGENSYPDLHINARLCITSLC